MTAYFGSCGPAITPGHSTTTRGVLDEDVTIQPVSAGQWRVCDNAWPQNDARNLLGFIEMTAEGAFSVAPLSGELREFFCTSLAAASAHFTATQAQTHMSTGNRIGRNRRARRTAADPAELTREPS